MNFIDRGCRNYARRQHGAALALIHVPKRASALCTIQLRLIERLSTPQSTRNHILAVKMLSRTAFRVSPMAQMAARRGFSNTRTQMSSPYHYPEGPRNNLPFNPRTKFFAFRFWGFMGLGFSLPFIVAVWQTYKN